MPLLVVLMALVLVRSFVVTPVAVHGSSMEPTVHEGIAFVARWTDPAEVERGDVIVLRDPTGRLSLKRVAALPGDVVAIVDAVLEVDGRPVAEPYLDGRRLDGTFFGPQAVPPGRVFVLGDNRVSSIDSRHYGPVRIDQVLGPVLFTR